MDFKYITLQILQAINDGGIKKKKRKGCKTLRAAALLAEPRACTRAEKCLRPETHQFHNDVT